MSPTTAKKGPAPAASGSRAAPAGAVVRRPAMQIKVAGLEQYAEDGDGKVQVLLFGEPGTGKTPWSAQWPKTLHLMCDRNGENSLVLTRSPFLQIRGKADMEAALKIAEQQVASGAIETVVLDTISVYSRHVAQEILTRNGLANMDNFKQWGELTAEVTRTLHRLQNMDANIIVLCHTKAKFDSDTKEIEPDLSGGAKNDLPKEFPYIGLLTTMEVLADDKKSKRTARQIQWRGTPQIPYLRSPSNILPEKTSVDFKSSDYEQVINALRKGAEKLSERFKTQLAELEQPLGGEVEPEIQVAAPDSVSGPVAAIDAAKVPKARAKKDEAAAPAPAVASDPSTWKAPAEASSPTPEQPAETPEAGDQAAEDTASTETAEPTMEEAVATVASVLDGEVVETIVDIATRIQEATTPEEFKTIWAENKNAWTDEYTALVQARKATLGL